MKVLTLYQLYPDLSRWIFCASLTSHLAEHLSWLSGREWGRRRADWGWAYIHANLRSRNLADRIINII